MDPDLLKKSIEKERKSSVDEKKGVFTSKYNAEENKLNAKVYLDQSLGNSLSGNFQQNLKKSFEQFKIQEEKGNQRHQIFVKSRQYINVPQHQNYHMNVRTENPRRVEHQPDVHFNYVSNQSRSPSPINYVPINHQQFVQPVPQEHLEVRRTFVPNKIYNYIPVGSSVTESHTENTHPPHNEEAYEVLLKEYEKLYDKFQKQEKSNEELSQIIQSLKGQKTQKGVVRERGRISLNMQLLHDKLYALYEQYLNGLIGAHKSKCQQKMRRLFDEAEKQVVVTEQVSSSHWIS